MTDAEYLRSRVGVNADGCWIWQGSTNGKYGTLGRRKVRRYAHRFAYATFIGPIPEGLIVCHKCDVPLCCNPAHLFSGTQRDNILDARRKGRMFSPLPVTGESHHNCKLTDAEVARAIAEVEAGATRAATARKYGVSFTAIDRYVKGTMRQGV